MELNLSWDSVFPLVLAALMFLAGIRDFQGKDPLINLPFNQYNRDPEYRAYWQKKNGILYMFNGVMGLLAYLIPSEHFGGFHLLGVAAAVDVVYLIVYEIWEHSNDCVGLSMMCYTEEAEASFLYSARKAKGESQPNGRIGK